MMAYETVPGFKRTMRQASVAILGISCSLAAAQAPDGSNAKPPSQDLQMKDMLTRAGSGHSPTPEEVRAVEAMPGLSDAKIAGDLQPLLQKALSNPDTAVRAFALAMLIGMQSLPDQASPAPAMAKSPAGEAPATTAPSLVRSGSLIAATGPAAYEAKIAQALTPLVPAVGHELTDDNADNRLLAANVLGGFIPQPPGAVYPLLLAYLKRDDAIGPVGLAVAGDLLQMGPLSEAQAQTIVRFLVRSDQTADTRANLVDAIASKVYQNKLVDTALLSYLDGDDDSLRARVILSLPLLDLTPEVYGAMKAKVDAFATGTQENPQVITAAKSVSPCWTQVKMAAGCPIY